MSKPYIAKATKSRFYVPKTLAADFDAFLDNDIPGAVMDYTVLDDWYDQFKDDYEPVIVRGEIYPDATKSRYSDTDNNLNIRCALNSGIKKGDMMIASEDNTIYLLDWAIAPQPNNRASRALRCNFRLTIKRYVEDELDDRGYLIKPAEDATIVDNLPVNGYRYDGRPEYSSHAGAPGITPNALTIVSIQFNSQTKNIRIDDEFQWGNEVYVIVDIDRVGLDISEEYGVLRLQCKKKAGGILGYD